MFCSLKNRKAAMLKKRKNRKGFTLVELVIVIAVLSIIAGIAIPTVHNVIGNANTAADNSNAQAIEMAIKTCESEHAANGTNPSAAIGDLFNGNAAATGKHLNDLLAAYGVHADLVTLRVSGHEFYYNSSTGTVAAKASSETGDVELKKTSDYEIGTDANAGKLIITN